MKDRNPWRSLMKVITFSSAFVVIAIIVGWSVLWFFTKTGDVYIPDVIGQDLTAALKTLQKQNLYPFIDKEIHHPDIPKNYIITQNPPAGTLRKRFSTVHLTLSAGPERLSMPDFRGYGIRQVERELNRMGLHLLAEIKLFSDTVGPGKIIAHAPGPGEICLPDENVKCIVSKGKKIQKYVMPDVIGKTLSDVVSGLRIIADPFIRFIPDSNYKAGTILDQFPLPGFPVMKNQRIELNVATKNSISEEKIKKSLIIRIPKGFLDRFLQVTEKDDDQTITLFQDMVHPGSTVQVIGLLNDHSAIEYHLSYIPFASRYIR